nr:MAG TPA: transmembrane domain protein [Caudoviricetes sp.]
MNSNVWCVYGILLLIAYAGCVDLYRLWKRRKDR